MFKQVFRLTFITFVWKQYKRVIVSTFLLFAYLWLVGKIHGDFLDYARLEQNSDVGTSFLIKWAALVFGALLYLFYHFTRRRKPASSDDGSARKNIAAMNVDDADDPFAEIRKRKKLRSRAEMLIEKEKEK